MVRHRRVLEHICGGVLKGFNKGKSRDEAIQYANKLYAEQWGKDKVIDMIS